jgi:hypothetical protein
MLYDDYKFHEIAYIYGFDGKKPLFRRNIIVQSTNVKNYFEKTDYFVSVARYNYDVQKYVAENNQKIAGFNGKVWYDFIVIDVDERSPEKVALFMDHLKINYGIEIDYCRLYFSGNKGFHILIPTPLFGLKPGMMLHNIIKRLVAKISENILEYDLSLYDKSQVYRLPHTRHSSSNLFKIPIDYSELSKGYDYIVNLAKEPRYKFDYPEYPIDQNTELVDLIDSANEAKKKDNFKSMEGIVYEDRDLGLVPPYRKRCYLHMMRGVPEGSRDEVAIRLAAHFKREKYPFDVIMGLLHGWNTLNNPPMTKEEIRAKVTSVFKSNFDYGCRDSVLLSYCDPNCYLFRR